MCAAFSIICISEFGIGITQGEMNDYAIIAGGHLYCGVMPLTYVRGSEGLRCPSVPISPGVQYCLGAVFSTEKLFSL